MNRRMIFVLVATLLPVVTLAGPIKDSIPKAIDKTAPAPEGFTGIKDPGRFKARPLLDWQFGLSQAAFWGSTWWDIDSTKRGIVLPGAYEKNKRRKARVESGDWPGVWRYQTKLNLGIGALSGGLKYAHRHNRRWYVRELWVVLPAFGTWLHSHAAYGIEKLIRQGR